MHADWMPAAACERGESRSVSALACRLLLSESTRLVLWSFGYVLRRTFYVLVITSLSHTPMLTTIVNNPKLAFYENRRVSSFSLRRI
jgi:hypothetical protein